MRPSVRDFFVINIISPSIISAHSKGKPALKLGIIGLPGSGKTTLFRALTGGIDLEERKGHMEPGLGVVKVNDSRLEFLVDYHKPRKVTPVHVQYTDFPGIAAQGQPARAVGDKFLSHARPLDALVHCVRLFKSSSTGGPTPLSDFRAVEDEMILSDLAVVEKRLERVNKEVQKGKKELSRELEFLLEASRILDGGKPLRLIDPERFGEHLRGFAFLSAKPQLVILNAGDDVTRDDIARTLEELSGQISDQSHMAVDWLYADTEAEIARLSPEDAREFLKEMALEHGAKERIISKSFDLLRLIVFFTAGEPEARAWPLEDGSTALKAAGTVHSDMERGFIRAEVVSFKDFSSYGAMAAAHKAGKVRLEGRDYVVQDGDIILFRFNV